MAAMGFLFLRGGNGRARRAAPQKKQAEMPFVLCPG